MISDSKMMIDQLGFFGREKLTRRELLQRTGIALAAVALTGTTYELSEGISLKKPPIDVEPVRLEKGIDYFRQLSYGKTEDGYERTLTITPDGKLFFEPSGEFFTSDKEFQYIHRANSVDFIHQAYKQGADLFDIDANDVGGHVYAEHGIVPQVDFSLGGIDVDFSLMVLDQHEKEIKLGAPAYSYEDLVAFVSSLSSPDRPLAISTELKRGDFALETLNEMLDIHLHYGVPVMMYSVNERLFDDNSM